MTLPTRGHAIIAFAIAALLGGCAGPMSRTEAQGYASQRMARYCGDRCGAYRITGAQRLKGRWLVDFDTSKRKLAVVVEDDGNTKVSVWDK